MTQKDKSINSAPLTVQHQQYKTVKGLQNCYTVTVDKGMD